MQTQFIIIANSARMLTELVNKKGYSCLVIDCFGDTDTQSQSVHYVHVESLALSNIKQVITGLLKQYQPAYMIYGSGLERYPETLGYLYQHFTVLNNRLVTVLAVQDKPSFFAILQQLNLPFPETCFTMPSLSTGWLTKPLQGEGGVGIKRYQDVNQTTHYWQKYQIGLPMSVLFIANGSDFKIVGFNKQSVISVGDNEFIFASIYTQPDLDIKQIQIYLHKIVSKFMLQGLNSLDFIWHHSQCYILEVNARPSASVQLYSDNLLDYHFNSLDCYQPLPFDDFIKNHDEPYQAYHIIFAERHVTIPKSVIWQIWVKDRPTSGTLIYTGQPICSIIASGKNEQQMNDLLLFRQHAIKQLLYAKDL